MNFCAYNVERLQWLCFHCILFSDFLFGSKMFRLMKPMMNEFLHLRVQSRNWKLWLKLWQNQKEIFIAFGFFLFEKNEIKNVLKKKILLKKPNSTCNFENGDRSSTTNSTQNYHMHSQLKMYKLWDLFF